MRRRALVVVGLAIAAATAGTGSALAAGGGGDVVAASRAGDTNGCVVIIPLNLAICIPRL